MAIAELYSGTELVSTTEWSLTTDTAGPDADATDGIFQAFVDFSALATGDQYQFRAYEKARSVDTQRVVYEAILSGASAHPILVTPSLVLLHGWDFTLKKLSGTDRTITWSIRQIS